LHGSLVGPMIHHSTWAAPVLTSYFDARGFDAAHSEAYKTCRLALGNRLLPRYDSEGGIFVYLTLGSHQCTPFFLKRVFE